MFVDASAIVAIIVREPDAPALAARIRKAGQADTSAIALYEAILGIARIRNLPVRGAEEVVDDFLRAMRVRVIPVTAEIGRGAIRAFERYGRGRHPAQLNMGDCFAYACARALGVPLLFKGDGFSQTDIAAG